MIGTDNRRLRYFLFSQYLADGVRVTLEIIIPVLVFSALGDLTTGLTIALGAFSVSIADLPGPVDHKRNGMLYCIAFVFLMSLLTGLVNQYTWLMCGLIAISAFFFSMISVFGIRAGSIGTAALLVMILRLSDTVTPGMALRDSLLIAAGGFWYLAFALIFYRLTPYRPAQRALGDCIHETAKFLRIKSELYDVSLNFDDEYRKLVKQQIVVNEKQDAVRELLFKDKEMMKEPSRTSRLLVLTFADAVDLFEQITATWYDYRQLREKYGATGILDDVSAIIKEIANELDQIGVAIQSNSTYTRKYQVVPALDALKIKVDAEAAIQSNLVLKKIIVNLRNLGEHVDELMNYFSLTVSPKGRMRSRSDYSKFVSHTEIDLKILLNNLNKKSGVFRHSLRMTITCLAGFTVAKMISYGHHSYWILLTIIILLKPGFSLTKERNIQRFAGTIAGGAIGLLILYFIHDRNILFGLIIFFMIGTYTYQRLNYVVMVIFTTPYVLILFNLLGLGFLEIAEERLLDTAIGCTLSFLSSYLLFPHWESLQLEGYMKKVLEANKTYLDKLVLLFSGKNISLLEYKLARKEVFISTANLAAAFNRMLSEPKAKQRNGKLIYEFVVLNHVLTSNVASLSAGMAESGARTYPREIVLSVKRSVAMLAAAIGNTAKEPESIIIETSEATEVLQDKHLGEQLDFVYKVAADINRITKQIAGETAMLP